MNKNLKKVISTIAALAISASSFVALAATSFPDVESTATYSQAVNELVSLGIVNGYEDGTFGPDKLVTRAEITKMIVATLGMTSSAEAAANQNTEFSDVTGSHWAAGYVTIGTTEGFINGMGDGTFAPDSNVQYLQAVKMLVGACGYTTWATNAGGWPSGYLSYGSQLEIGKNVSGVQNDTELNRGQVAQMIDNALNAPVCVQDGFTTNAFGNSVANLVQKNGTGEDFQTLLTKKHTAYKVYGRVTSTHRTGGVDADEVKFQVEKADNFDDEYYKTGDTPNEITAKIGDSNADNYLLEYSQAVVKKTANDDWEILSITSTAKNDTVSYSADDFDDENSGYTTSAYSDKIMYFYTNEAQTKTSSYKLEGYSSSDESEVVYYVNGVKDAITSQETFDKYITNNETGTVTLIDSPAVGSTSTNGRYDYVMVTYYADAIVDSVTESSSTPKIYFDEYDNNINSSLEVDLDNDDIDYSFTHNDAAIEVTDIAEDDVLSIAYDVTSDFESSDFYEVLVSRDTVAGKVTAYDSEDGYQISGTYYKPNEAIVDNDTQILDNGTEYTLYLNVFGKFVSYDEGDSTNNLAVLDSMYTQYGSETWVSIIDQTGKKASYKVRKTGSNVLDAANALFVDQATTEADIDMDGTKKDYYNRVIEFSINSSSELTVKSVKNANATTADYKAKTNKVGSVKLSDSSVILDFTDYLSDDTFGLMSLSSFVDESEYTVYAFSKSSADSTYRFVIVGKGGSDISGTSTMAVYSSQGTTTNDSGEDATQIKAYVNGEAKYLVLDTDLDGNDIDDANLAEGTPFFYTLNGSGYVDTLYPIMDETASAALSDEDTFRTKVFAAATADTNGSFDSVLTSTFYNLENNDSDENAVNFGTSSDKAYIHFGPVVDKVNSNVTLAKITDATNGYTNVDDCEDYSLADGAKVYVYDYKPKATKRVETGSKGSIVKTTLSGAWTDSDKNIADWSKVEDVKYALLKVYDDDATEGLVIANSGN